jgi:hypothetical protein
LPGVIIELPRQILTLFALHINIKISGFTGYHDPLCPFYFISHNLMIKCIQKQIKDITNNVWEGFILIKKEQIETPALLIDMDVM